MPKLKQPYYNIPKPQESDLSQKDLEAIKGLAIAFFLKDIESLKLFVKKMREDFGQSDLLFALKMYVFSRNVVFNMAEYMSKQSKHVEEYIKLRGKDFSPEEKRDILAKWIDENARSHRKRAIFEQIYCIDKMAGEIIPIIEEAIKE